MTSVKVQIQMDRVVLIYFITTDIYIFSIIYYSDVF